MSTTESKLREPLAFIRECREMRDALKAEYGIVKRHAGVSYADFAAHPFVGRVCTLLLQAEKLVVGSSGAEPHPDKDSERHRAIGAAIERACCDLPSCFDITLHLENGYGGAVLEDDCGERSYLNLEERDLAAEINAGIDTALAQAEAAKGKA